MEWPECSSKMRYLQQLLSKNTLMEVAGDEGKKNPRILFFLTNSAYFVYVSFFLFVSFVVRICTIIREAGLWFTAR